MAAVAAVAVMAAAAVGAVVVPSPEERPPGLLQPEVLKQRKMLWMDHGGAGFDLDWVAWIWLRFHAVVDHLLAELLQPVALQLTPNIRGRHDLKCRAPCCRPSWGCGHEYKPCIGMI